MNGFAPKEPKRRRLRQGVPGPAMLLLPVPGRFMAVYPGISEISVQYGIIIPISNQGRLGKHALKL
jgi:hypothetical protein